MIFYSKKNGWFLLDVFFKNTSLAGWVPLGDRYRIMTMINGKQRQRISKMKIG